ncbi:MAG: UDP-N-acetylglucosamine 2-epimerase (non-hydrolyzing) [Actinomycetia bacterium]|nr:UDP-N-acetylglucosamine 2-epimerase (non-hydrolyzing) [Actinomycetes bacterium]
MRVICVAAARPNFMKVKPVMDALEAKGAEVVLVHTGQHYDPSMSDVFFEDLGIREPDHHLGVGSGTHAEHTGQVMVAFEQLLDSNPADVLVVVGDVNSTLACAIVGAKAGVRVAHVEAGLRSRDWDMPEEVNRVVADRVSDYLFAPSADAVENLRSEGYRDDQIHLAGNVMIDTLLSNADRARERDVVSRLGLHPGAYGLVTLHRPSNVDEPEVLEDLLGTLGEIAGRLPLVFSVHPRTRAKIEGLGMPDGITVTEPLGYLDFLALQASSALVLTDSGGIQEETTALGIPCLTLRTTTERPITISDGTNQLVGIERDAILRATSSVLDDGVEPRCPAIWDGHAGQRIADVIMTKADTSLGPRPTDLAAEVES